MRALAAEFPSDVISLNEYDVLFNITRAPGRRLRLKDLNRSVLITQPSVSRLVDRLASRGLVSKTHDPDDGRGTIVAHHRRGLRALPPRRVHGTWTPSTATSGTPSTTRELQRPHRRCATGCGSESTSPPGDAADATSDA